MSLPSLRLEGAPVPDTVSIIKNGKRKDHRQDRSSHIFSFLQVFIYSLH
jgi:hypothetical protein